MLAARIDTSKAAYAQPVAAWETNYAPYNSVGMVQTVVNGETYRGSGAVVRDQRLIYSCGHMVYDSGKWASVFRFARAYHSYYEPQASQYRTARGYRVLSGYAPFGYSYDFDDDFSVAYAGAGGWFGPALAVHPNPIQAVESANPKMILGYPSDLDHTYAYETGRSYLHRTGPFYDRYYDEDASKAGGEYWREGITTGSGNSGGPMVVWDSSGFKMAGVLVSGTFMGGSGVYVLGSEAEQAATLALGQSTYGTTTTRWAWPNGWIQNGSTTYASRNFDFTGVPTQTMDVKIKLGIYTSRRGDIDAFVRSPAGRIKVIAWRDPSNTAAHLILNDQDITQNFQYYGASGVWQLYFRDVFQGNASWFQYASLAVRSRWTY